MKVIYVAGPYRSITEMGVYSNILIATQYAVALWDIGYSVICPHCNTAHFEHFGRRADGSCLSDDTWLKGDLEIIRRCDVMFLLPGWKQSSGATMEHDLAVTLDMQFFETLEDARQWLRDQTHREMEKAIYRKMEEAING